MRGSRDFIQTILFAALITASALVQSESTCAAPSAADSTGASEQRRERITTREIEGTGKKIAMLPVRVLLLPFKLVGAGLEAGFETVEEKNLINRSTYFRRRLRATGLSLSFGVGYDGAGLGARVGWTPPRRKMIVPTLTASLSTNLYQIYGLRLDFSRMFDNRAAAVADVRYISLPQEDFFGMGQDSRRDDRTTYKREAPRIVISMFKQVRPKLRLEADIGYQKDNILSGEDEKFPSIEDVFDPADVPGLDTGAELLLGTLVMEWMNLDRPGDPRSGMFIRLLGGIAEDLRSGEFDHWRYGLDFRVYLPMLGWGNRFGPRSTLAIRVKGDFTEPMSGGDVPFFRMPTVGGSTTLRGFTEFRFTDRNAIVTNVEYKYPIQKILEAVIFWDEGQVFHTMDEFNFHKFRSSFGGGMRLILENSAFVSMEVGTGSEETRFYFKFGKAY